MTKRLGLISLVVMLLVSILINVYLFNRAHQYYLDLNAVRLDPIGLSVYPTSSPEPGNPNRMRVVFFGDSRAAHWPAPANLDRFEFINRGVEAQTAAQALLRFRSHVLPLQPHVIVVQVGVNDLKTIPLFPQRRAEIVAATQENVRQIVEQSKALGAQIILTTIFPAGEFPLERRLFWSPEIESAVEEANAYLRSLADEQVSIFDAASLLTDNGSIKAAYYADELHLNATGYAALNSDLVQLLNNLAVNQ